MRFGKILFLSMILALVLSVSAVFAQTEELEIGAVSVDGDTVVVINSNPDSLDGEVVDDINVTEGVIIGGWDSVAELEVMEGVEIEEPTKVPSGLGLFWRGVRERVSVGITFDPVKKAEKRLEYAARRMRLAEYMVENSDDSRVQERAERVVRRASNLMEKVEKKKEKWVENTDERSRRLLKNITSYQVRKDRVWDVIEERLPEERVDKLKELREEGLERGRRLMNAIENGKAPEPVKEHLRRVKEKVEQHAQEVRLYRERRVELLKDAKEGDDVAKDKLKDLRENRVEKLKSRREVYKEKRGVLIEAAKEGDQGAKKKLKVMDKVKNAVQERREEKKEDRKERVEDLKEGASAGNAAAVKKLKAIKKINDLKASNKKVDTETVFPKVDAETEEIVDPNPTDQPNKVFSPGGFGVQQ